MVSNSQTQYDVFLSHSHEDANAVEILATHVEDDASLSVWLDKWVLVPGEHWQQAMAKGLHEAKTCAVCIGKNTPRGWFKEEIERALNRQTKCSSFRVIPVLLPGADNTAVDDFLELRTWVDFKNGLDDSSVFHYLVCGIKGISPGRITPTHEEADSGLQKIQEKLIKLRNLRDKKLIDDDIAIEYQRRLLDDIFD